MGFISAKLGGATPPTPTQQPPKQGGGFIAQKLASKPTQPSKGVTVLPTSKNRQPIQIQKPKGVGSFILPAIRDTLFTKRGLKQVGSTFVDTVAKPAKTIGELQAAKYQYDLADKTNQGISDMQIRVLRKARAAKTQEEYDKWAKEWESLERSKSTPEADNESLSKTGLQLVGENTMFGLQFLGGGAAQQFVKGGIKAGAKAVGAKAITKAAGKTFLQGAKTTVPISFGYGAAGAAASGERDPGKIALSGAAAVPTGLAFQAGLQGLGAGSRRLRTVIKNARDRGAANRIARTQQPTQPTQPQQPQPQVADDANPLLTEARKYKSAEEFANAQGTPVSRGGFKYDPTKEYKNGISVSESRDVAKGFQKSHEVQTGKPGVIEDFVISPEAKIATRADMPKSLFKTYKSDLLGSYGTVDEQGILSWARKNGYDAVDYRTFGTQTATREGELRILNPDVLKTKSQLTSIWEEAQGKMPKPTTIPTVVTERSIPVPKSTGVNVKQGFRSDKLNLQKEQEAAINRTLESLGLGKRKVRTFEDMQKAAAELGTDPKTLFNNSGRSLSDSQVVGLRNFINEQSELITSGNKSLAGASLTTAERKVTEGLVANAEANIQSALKRLVRGGTESGRSVAAFRILANRTMEPQAWYRIAQRQLGNREFTPAIREAIDGAIKTGDRLALARPMQGLGKSSTTDKVLTAWKAVLLSNPATDIANVSGNVFMTALEETKKIPAVAFDKIYSIFSKKRTTYIDPLIARQQLGGIGGGVRKAGEILRYGDDAEALLSKYDFGKGTNFDSKFWQGYTQTVFRRLGAEDALFREPALRGSIAEQALAQVRNAARGRNIPRTEQVRQFTELLKKPTQEMIMRAKAEAAYRTFQSDSPLARGLGSLAKQSTGAKIGVEVAAPFRRTPINIVNTAIDYSPFGVPKTIFQAVTNKLGAQANQKFVVDGLARSLTGTSLAAVGYVLAKNGLIIGMPADEAERNRRRAMGISDNSIFVGGKWRRIDRFAPGSNILLLGANTYNQFSSDKPTVEKVAGVGAGILKTISEQSFVKGASGMLKAINDPERYAGSWVEQTIASSIPALAGAFARGGDPSERNIDGPIESLKSRIPGQRQTLTPQINVFGEERKQQRGALGQIFNPVISTPPDQTGAAKIIQEANYAPGLPKPQVTKDGETITLKGEQRTQFEKEMGKATLKAILSAPRNPRWKGMDKDERASLIRRLVDKERDAVRKRWVRKVVSPDAP